MEQPIKIEILDIDSYYRQMEKYFLQHFYSNKTLIPILIFFGIGIFLLISGFLSGYDLEIMTLKNGQEEVTHKNYGISIGIGCGLILYSILKFLDIRKSKKATELLYSIKRNRERKVNDKVEFTLSENKISYSSSLNSWNKKWEFYDYYKMTNNNLNLYSNSYYSGFPELVIPLNDLNSEQIEFLNKYISGKVKNYS
ncbi:hypothetical protein H9W90_10010 [Polaribacter pectinis]|uniref:YcxB-like protein domain-containing protein n=1 Tax=Polaribacter pectinis TaxID=2738844 RepID=A0A7G9L7D1_9FLAO|nr:hypothetical protein [Polaribacter pectinis]QNM84530.1 hypothetical protein H9W90_10010 [Polaribacter pectinis]